MSRPPAGQRLLSDACELVSAGWCRGAEARDRDGLEVDPWTEEARSWSLLGALVAILEREAALREEVSLDQLAAALAALAHFVETDSLAAWNDAPGRGQREVSTALAGAAELFEDPWAALEEQSLN